MKNITFVTTFHKEGLEVYGQRFLDSFSNNVDTRCKLLVYAEDCTPKVHDERIIVYDAKQKLPKLNQFKETWKDVPKANGKCPFPEKRPRDFQKEFKWNAIRFANKVYAVFDACDTLKEDWCVWIDADTIVHSPWMYGEMIELFPDDKWITYVGRGKGSQTWPECGFYGLNLNNNICHIFLKTFENMYEDAEHGIFTLQEWHDSFVFGTILDNLKKTNPNVLDYSEDVYLTIAKTGGGGHPLINSVLGKWIDHMKGDRKFNGKSKKKDLMQARTEQYWNEI